MNRPKTNIAQRTLKLASRVSLLLGFIKLLAFLVTNSMVVLVSAFDSLADAITSSINKFVNKKALEKADKEHPFGHGGFEVVGGLVQGLVLLFLGLGSFIECLQRVLSPSEIQFEDSSLFIAVAVLFASAVSGGVIYFFIKHQIAEQKKIGERSIALIGDKAHYSSDAWLNLFSALGVLGVYITDLKILDPIVGCLGSLMLILVSFPVLKRVYKDIMQNEAHEGIQEEVRSLVLSFDARIKGIHLLRTRELGPQIYIDFHLELEATLSLIEAHEISQKVNKTIKEKFPNADILIHLDPNPPLRSNS